MAPITHEKVKKEPWSKLGVNVEKNFDPIYCIPKNKQKIVTELKKHLNFGYFAKSSVFFELKTKKK